MMRDQLAAALKDAMKSKECRRGFPPSVWFRPRSRPRYRQSRHRQGRRPATTKSCRSWQRWSSSARNRRRSTKRTPARNSPLKNAPRSSSSQDFMPKQLSEAEVRANVAAAIAEAGASRPEGHGQGHGGAEGALCRPDGFRQGVRRSQGTAVSSLTGGARRRLPMEGRVDDREFLGLIDRVFLDEALRQPEHIRCRR